MSGFSGDEKTGAAAGAAAEGETAQELAAESGASERAAGGRGPDTAAGPRSLINSGRNSGGAGKGRKPGTFLPGNPHRFVKGRSGNPRGRPKGVTAFSGACRRALAEAAGGDLETVAEQLARVAVRLALAGSAQHLKEINERVEGKARRPINLRVENPRERLAAILGCAVEEIPEGGG